VANGRKREISISIAGSDNGRSIAAWRSAGEKTTGKTPHTAEELTRVQGAAYGGRAPRLLLLQDDKGSSGVTQQNILLWPRARQAAVNVAGRRNSISLLVPGA